MKSHYKQENATKYLLISLVIAMLATAALSEEGSIHVAISNAETLISDLFHVLAG